MKELVCDKFYRNGFELHHVDKLVTNRPIAVFDLKNTAKAYPSWQLAQWCCKNNLANGSVRNALVLSLVISLNVITS